MKTKLLKKLRKEAEESVELVKDRATSEYRIRKVITDYGIIVYTPILYRTKDEAQAKKLLKQAKRQYILNKLGIKRITG